MKINSLVNEELIEVKDTATDIVIEEMEADTIENIIGDGCIDDAILDDFEKRFAMKEDELEEEIVEVDSEGQRKLEKAVKEYQQGITESFDYIYDFYRPKLERLGYRKNDEDLVQELSIVLLKAIETYDKSCGAKFNTYFWKCARNHIGTLNIRKSAKKRTAENGVVSMQQSLSVKDSEAEIGDFIEDKDAVVDYDDKIFRMFLDENVYKYLKDNEIKAIEMLLLGYTLEEIGAALGGITAPAVHIKFRRLKDKKVVGKHLRQLLESHCS